MLNEMTSSIAARPRSRPLQLDDRVVNEIGDLETAGLRLVDDRIEAGCRVVEE